MARVRRAAWLVRSWLRRRGWLPPEVLPAGARVTTYNIGRGARGDRGARSTTLDRVAATIAAPRPDVVALQEVHEPDVAVVVEVLWREHGLVYDAAFGAALDAEAMRAVVERARRRPGFDAAFWADRAGAFGVALLSRRPIADVRVEELPGTGEQRVALLGRTALAGADVGVVVTHVATARRAQERDAQTRHVLALAAAVDGPVVVAGDLNQEPATVEVARAAVAPGLVAATDPHAPTLGWRAIDHVLVGGGIEPLGATVGTEGVSDHRPVTVALRL